VTGDDIDIPNSLRHFPVHKIDPADLVYGAAVILDTIKVGKARLRAIEEKEIEQQEKVEGLAAQYIQKSLSELEISERTYRSTAYVCYSIAYLTLIGSVFLGTLRLWHISPDSLDWVHLTYQLGSSLIIFGLLFALSRFAFMMGKAFMTEALRNADRRHAISFGHFYLRAFGQQANLVEVKEDFQHWNIDKGSYFSQQSASDYDPELVRLIVEMAKSVRRIGADG
jgi:hypothetical protein